MAARLTDALGVSVRIGDTVTVSARGYGATADDVHRVGLVTGLATSRAHVTFDDNGGNGSGRPAKLLISTTVLNVNRRDGAPGFEGNRKTECNCGSLYYQGCLCNITIREFLASIGRGFSRLP